jgi:hypothetical protein
MRDVGSNNLATDEDPNFPALQNAESVNAWYLVNDDARSSSEWKRGPYDNVYAGYQQGNIPLQFTLKDSAAGATISTRVRILVNGTAIGVSATVNVVVPLYTPTPAVPNTPTITPTPIVSEGHMAAYPQPARDRVCFDYIAPAGAGSELRIQIFNLAFQKVADLKDTAADGVLQTTCADFSALAPGLYLARAVQGNYSYPAIKFGIVR